MYVIMVHWTLALTAFLKTCIQILAGILTIVCHNHLSVLDTFCTDWYTCLQCLPKNNVTIITSITMLGNIFTWAPFHKELRLIASFLNTRFAIELQFISIVRLIVTLCETGPCRLKEWNYIVLVRRWRPRWWWRRSWVTSGRIRRSSRGRSVIVCSANACATKTRSRASVPSTELSETGHSSTTRRWENHSLYNILRLNSIYRRMRRVGTVMSPPPPPNFWKT